MDFSFISQYYIAFLKGISVTLLLSLIAIVFGFIIGLIVCIGKISTIKLFKLLASIYIEIIRGTPLVVQVMIIAFGLPTIGFKFPAILGLKSEFIAVSFALTINSSAYISEIMRSGINSVDKGQMEACRSLGLSYFKALKFIVIPQAIKNILPSLINEFVSLVKESAIVSFVGITDVMFIATSVKNSNYLSLEPYIFVASIYFIITFSLSKLVNLLQKKMAN